jgi:hypothetical protein
MCGRDYETHHYISMNRTGFDLLENRKKIFYILENYPGISLFVQANPAFCCPSLVTEAMTSEIKQLTGVPVVTLTYDGTNDYKNDVIIPYLQGKKII